jgi:hypothetical protein
LGSGSIISNDVTYANSGAVAYNANAIITLKPAPAANSNFTGWSGDCSGTGTCKVKMTGAKSVTATYALKVAPPSTYALTINKTGTGLVESDALQITCGDTCEADVSTGSIVTLRATPPKGHSFTGWSGTGCFGTGTCKILMNGDKTIGATFN